MNLILGNNAAGQLAYTDHTGKLHENILVVRAYPLSAPAEGISLIGADGHELAWIADARDLPEDGRNLLAGALARREFMPRISRIKAVSSHATPSTWSVATDRGDTELILNSEDHIRRLTLTTLLITDSQGISFLLDNANQLDRHSRKLLERFL